MATLYVSIGANFRICFANPYVELNLISYVPGLRGVLLVFTC